MHSTAKSINTSQNLSSLIQQMELDIKKSPTNFQLRWGYFQYLCIMGAWTRALKQLQTYAQLSQRKDHFIYTLRELIICEQHREAALIKGTSRPSIIEPRVEWQDQLLSALQNNLHNNITLADAIRHQALAKAPESKGLINNSIEFDWITNSDTRIGPNIELFYSGLYNWCGFEHISTISFTKPTSLIDVIWRPASIELSNNTTIHAYIPARYPIHANSTDQQKLTQVTEWDDQGETLVRGDGQEMWLTNSADICILEVMSLSIEH